MLVIADAHLPHLFLASQFVTNPFESVIFFEPDLLNLEFFLSVLFFFSGWNSSDSTTVHVTFVQVAFHVLVSSYFPNGPCFYLRLSSFKYWYWAILQITLISSHLFLSSRIDTHVTSSTFPTVLRRLFICLFSLHISISRLNYIFH